uniref:Uncharacterized protein n=1 Tax=Daphnia galeata TaxID=27404 RepID=A0A8J2WMA8_9CRUS|nr:unnamed protein product [Daphnia galeata]
METMNINSVSVVMDDSSTTFSVTQQQDNQLLLVSNRQSRDIIDSSNQHQPMKMVDPIEVFKQTGKVVTKTSEEREKEKHEERTGDPTQMVFDAVMAAPCTVMVSYFTKQLLFFTSYL